MAIKGKGRARARSGRRVIAAPPRPQIVVRKPPIWKRRWVWAVVAGLAVASIVVGVVLSVQASHRRSFRDREAAALDSLAHRFVSRFPKDRQESPGNLFVFYPSFNGSLDDLSNGKLSPGDAVTKGESVSSSAVTAQRGVSSVQVTSLIPVSFTASPTPGVSGKGATQQAMTDARFLMEQAFRLYQEAGNLLVSAAGATGKTRSDLVDQARQVFSQADGLFSQGLRKILTTADSLGSPLALTSSVHPPVTPPPTASPSPSATASKSPKPKASASP